MSYFINFLTETSTKFTKNYLSILFGFILLLFFFPLNIIDQHSFIIYFLFTIFLCVFSFYSRIGPLISLIWYPMLSTAILSPLSWMKLYFRAIDTENIFLFRILDSSSPNFQDNPKFLVAIMLFFVFTYFQDKQKFSWKIFNLLSLFFVLLFSSFYPFFTIILAYQGAKYFSKLEQSNNYLKYKQAVKYILPCCLITAFIFVVYNKNKIEVPSNFDFLIMNMGDNDGGKLLIDYDLKNNLSNNYITANLFPNFKDALRPNGNPDISYLAKTSEFDDYYSIVSLQPKWKELLDKNKISFALLHRDNSLAGVLIEAEKWKIIQASAPVKYIERGVEKLCPIVVLAKE